MKKTTLQAGAAALAAAAMLLAGCGSSDSGDTGSKGTPAATQATDNGVAALTADEILAKAKEALKKAGSFQVKGSQTSEGTTVSIDFRISGDDFAGSMSMGEGADVELLSVGGKQYMKPAEGFWAMLAGPEQAKKMAAATGDKWILVPAKDETATGLFAAGNVDELLKPTGKLAKGEAAKVGDTAVITLTDAGDATAKLFVATTGDAYPVKIGADAAGDGILFSEFGATFADIKAPAAGEFIEKSSLGK
ncbi:hypothetical protein FHR83_002888 [Actinoplanes campanulatus]|uniref:Lipoprotein n=1 Tax=Actinoplanes campanulatus TaxID=113559 RepID=A0A7W5AFR6_9ACTN|nr:hypothetical protein [Actinoplanes campanulatus]MBB3095225.1 hypothetical protein [Actinoplanes campanulatus]GGN24278.1 hypothetical protein GCM10010109_39710 [Actinoplanes campanulatus]GID34830.1 hypothetical protein Aca09nite_13360 [Actinoplanes campanulatus]